jgi:membrane fusion protein, multidrug efflux system
MRVTLTLVLLGVLAGCGRQAPPPLVRPVQTIVVHYGAAGEQVTLSGQIQAQIQANLAFRIGGRLIERRVNIGDRVTPGQVVARIESQDPQNSLRSAQADLAAAQATLVQARNNEARYRALVSTGVISRAQYDDAQQQLAAAQSRVTATESTARTARDNVGYTELRSDVAGIVTGKGAEPGEVVQAGQMVVQIAQKGGTDAVFNVPALLMRQAPNKPAVTVALSDDPQISVIGHVREVSPQADPTTGTYLVKVGLENPPDTMRLGATVVGRTTLNAEPVVRLPGTALIQIDGKASVWVVDPVTQAASSRAVTVLRYDADAAVIGGGLHDGERVVTAGVHALLPGQRVRLLPDGG